MSCLLVSGNPAPDVFLYFSEYCSYRNLIDVGGLAFIQIRLSLFFFLPIFLLLLLFPLPLLLLLLLLLFVRRHAGGRAHMRVMLSPWLSHVFLMVALQSDTSSVALRAIIDISFFAYGNNLLSVFDHFVYLSHRKMTVRRITLGKNLV